MNHTMCDAEPEVWEWCTENWTDHEGKVVYSISSCMPKGMCECWKIHSEVSWVWGDDWQDWEKKLEIACEKKTECAWVCEECLSNTELAIFGLVETCDQLDLSLDGACCAVSMKLWNEQYMDLLQQKKWGQKRAAELASKYLKTALLGVNKQVNKLRGVVEGSSKWGVIQQWDSGCRRSLGRGKRRRYTRMAGRISKYMRRMQGKTGEAKMIMSDLGQCA